MSRLTQLTYCRWWALPDTAAKAKPEAKAGPGPKAFWKSVEETAQRISELLHFLLCIDVSLRNLIRAELARGFGFVQSKPSSAFSPVAVTPDELTGWSNYRLQGRLRCSLMESCSATLMPGSMVHGFDRLVAHAAKIRALSAGSIIGGGTVANADPARHELHYRTSRQRDTRTRRSTHAIPSLRRPRSH